jgi:hypothetical protein
VTATLTDAGDRCPNCGATIIDSECPECEEVFAEWLDAEEEQ